MKESIPPIIATRLHNDWEAFQCSLEEANLVFTPGDEFKAVLWRVWSSSVMISRYCIEHAPAFIELVHSGDLHRDRHPAEIRQSLQQCLQGIKNEDDLMEPLRTFRHREMIRIAWRDLAGWAPLDDTLRDLSLLADACVDLTLSLLHRWSCKQWGTPRCADGTVQQLVVLGMGKLGAYELNFSSDIDLIFAYPEDGLTRQRKGLTCEEFFTRLGRQLIRVIDTATHNGFVFRVDMRLRPYGESGALVASFAAIEEYYQYQGREWERYALIKARVIAGDFVAGRSLIKDLRPFTYRRYLDYSAFESLRDMKAMIARQITIKGMEDNIKLGSGGIREIEFIGQAFQLIRGGREPELQVRGIMPVLRLLAKNGYLPQYVTQQLLTAYVFLRHSENHLQAYAEQQTHMLPVDEDEQLSLALSMGYTNWSDFLAALQQHRETVHSAFEQIMVAPQVADGDAPAVELAGVWQGQLDSDASKALLSAQGYQDAAYVLGLIQGLRNSQAYLRRSTIGRARMDQLMPLLLGAVAHAHEPDQCLVRLVNLLEAISGRSTYLALLTENPMALSQVVQLFSQSAWIAEYLTQYPVLLDEFLDPRFLYTPRIKSDLVAELAGLLRHLDDNDLEQQMETLRYFKQSNVLHVAAADLVDAMSLVEVSSHLTDIAEVILVEVLNMTRGTLQLKYGEPRCVQDGKTTTPGFAVIAYGKMGGIELGYSSDLDLVFLHNSSGSEQTTTGPKVLDNPVFFGRLGQRFIHTLNTHTASGILYEVDMRLRPSGASGMLVSDVEAFRHYQLNDAWTWEHQALVRARAVVGDPELIESFDRIRKEILCQPRNASILRLEVMEMRERMREEFGSKRVGVFHLKQDVGGMADIEFITQYMVLRWAHEFPDLVTYSDNLRQLEGLKQQGLLEASAADGLFAAYRTYRAYGHRQALDNLAADVSVDHFSEHRQLVSGVWKQIMLEGGG